VLVYEDGRLVAAAPAYLKSHSMGEFVFDHAWAEAAERAGIRYYPKLLVGVPFTPATGVRIATAEGHDRRALIRVVGRTLSELCDAADLSSVHVNFCLEEEAAALGRVGYLRRVGLQYHWHNAGYESFDDYVARFRSKRRNQIRRELREAREQGVEIEALDGEDIPDELFGPMFRLYKSTIDKLYWGRQYLREEFFTLMARRFKRNLCFVVARHSGEIVGGTFNVQKGGVFYGRYWGCTRELRHLHFNVCYYAAIAHCIRRRLARFEPGAGGEFKRLRGFEPQETWSVHYLRDPRLADAVGAYLRSERRYVRDVIAHLGAASELKAC
jgi:hypothetical protein